MTRPDPDDDRFVDLDDDAPPPTTVDPEASSGTVPDRDRYLLDELPPHWG